jgi:hypothetical protein
VACATDISALLRVNSLLLKAEVPGIAASEAGFTASGSMAGAAGSGGRFRSNPEAMAPPAIRR